MTAKIYTFKGGISIGKDMRTAPPAGITDQPLAEHLAVPLLEYWGSYSIPLVSAGDHVSRGQLIAQHSHPLGVPKCAPTSGRITGISDHHLAHPSGLKGSCITIAADGKDSRISNTPVDDYRTLDTEQTLRKIREGGITGMGGGGYPAHAKLEAAIETGTSLLIINALECEPLISCDEALIDSCPDEIIKGVNILHRLLAPSRCVIAIKDGMMQANRLLTQAASRYADQSIEIITLPDVYPIGSEKLLIYCLTGIRLDASTIPATRGIVCQNVASVKAIFDCVVLGQPVTSRVITVAGENISAPLNLRTRIGTPIQSLLANCAERTERGRRLSLGGPLNGYPLPHADAPVDAHHNCILSNPIEASEVAPCIKCGYCAEVCPTELLPQRLLWHAHARQLDQLIKLNIAECIECGACDTVCPSKLPLTATFRYARDRIRLDNRQHARASEMQARFNKHQQRLLAQEASRQQKLREKSLKQNKKGAAEIIQAALKRAREAKSQGGKK